MKFLDERSSSFLECHQKPAIYICRIVDFECLKKNTNSGGKSTNSWKRLVSWRWAEFPELDDNLNFDYQRYFTEDFAEKFVRTTIISGIRIEKLSVDFLNFSRLEKTQNFLERKSLLDMWADFSLLPTLYHRKKRKSWAEKNSGLGES